MYYLRGEFEVIVIGGGHAGIEASLACARMGIKTLLVTLNLDSIGFMPCNPSIGGTAKGHLVKEIDALGGQMGLTADECVIQGRMLNTSKGPAVHSLRFQVDKLKYQKFMKNILENQENLTLIQGEVKEIHIENRVVKGIILTTGGYFKTNAVVVCTGVYLNSKVIIGENIFDSGPNGLLNSKFLTKTFLDLGVSIRRFKTGTPARINKQSVDFSKVEKQEGDIDITPFSFLNKALKIDQVECYLTYTNEKTHNIIKNNIDKSPMYNGSIKGIGPRYCPSIEDKIMRFGDKSRHQIFIEPEGLHTSEMYLQGMSSSLPENIQIDMIKTISGLENVEIMRTGYAIEYDVFDTQELKLTLEFKNIKGLFSAGQINGTSGYEEAASQGLIAGINAALYSKKKEPFILDRSDAYIGVLIDDLINKGTDEPYRIMTSRAEYRLLLRQDNADLRLTQKGYDIGIVDEKRYKIYKDKKNKIDNEIIRIKNLIINNSNTTNKILESINSVPLKKPITLYELIKRTELDYYKVKLLDEARMELDPDICNQINIISKYEGYIEKQKDEVKGFKKMENKLIPEKINYDNIKGLRLEAIQKLNKIKPRSLGQALRIPGVSCADITVLMLYIEALKRSN